jgi:predicted ABC-type ATPase
VWDDPDEKKTSPFEKALQELAETVQLFPNLAKLDERCGVGRYGCLFLGLSDGGAFDQPVRASANLKLNYVTPLFQEQARIAEYDRDEKSERFGLPTMYEVQFDDETFMQSVSGTVYNTTNTSGPAAGVPNKRVHYTRIVHVAPAEPCGTIYGFSRLHAPYNLLQGLEQTLGSGSEAYYRTAYPGMSIEASPDVEFDSTDAEMEDEIENYVHGLTRFMRLRGAQAKSLSPNAQDPSGVFEVQMDALAVMTRIPKRILLGNEAGELASSQDMTTWNNRVMAYRKNFTIPCIVLPVLRALITLKVLPLPKKNVLGRALPTVEWPEKEQHTESERADIAAKRVGAMNQYVSGGATQLIPPLSFLTDELGYDQDAAEAYLEEIANMQEEMAAMQEREEALSDEEEDEGGFFTNGVKANYGTSEGAKKAWDTRGRGRKEKYDEGTERYKAELAKYPAVNENADSSMARYKTADGQFTPERKALHTRIENAILSKATRVDNPVSYMLGGGPASGKSTVVKTLAQSSEIPTNIVAIDADYIKAQLPDFHVKVRTGGSTAESAAEGAAFTHLESSHIATNIIRRAAMEGKNIILDGTGDGSFEKLAMKVKELRGEGRPVHALYATISVEAAIARNQQRYEGMKEQGITPRKVPEVTLRAIHADVSKLLYHAATAGLYDSLKLYDTEHRNAPKVIATAKGDKLTIVDQKGWETFMHKGRQ